MQWTKGNGLKSIVVGALALIWEKKVKIIVNNEMCIGCNICVKVCPQKVLELRDLKSYCFDIERCMGCFGCEDECPHNAIRVIRAPQYVKDIKIEPPLNISECDVAIVGAGPAGIGAAITCAKAGLNTVVFERLPNRELSHHTDGGVLFTMPEISSVKVENSKILFPELDISINSDIVRKCEALGLIGPNGLSTISKIPDNIKGYASNKDKLIKSLIEEAENAGAKVWFNAKVTDVLKSDNNIIGVKLESGEEIKAKVTITADGIMAKISEKAGMKISKKEPWYVNVLAYEWDNIENLPSQLYYLNGGMKKFDENVDAIFGAVAITDVVHVMAVTLSRKKFNPSDKPIDYFVEQVMKDDRITNFLSKNILSQKPKVLTGCRGIFRDKPNRDIVVSGAVSVGDAWVDDGEIGNVGALSHGVHAAKVIIKAFEKNDFSKESLLPANDFITDNLVSMLEKNKEMKLLDTKFSEDELLQMFEIMKHMNYPVMLLGSKTQQAKMFTGFMFKNFINMFRYFKVFKKLM